MECCDARQVTQLTVGVLLLNRAMFASVKVHTISSMTRNMINNPAILRSEFVIVPFKLLSDLMLSVMSFGH